MDTSPHAHGLTAPIDAEYQKFIEPLEILRPAPHLSPASNALPHALTPEQQFQHDLRGIPLDSIYTWQPPAIDYIGRAAYAKTMRKARTFEEFRLLASIAPYAPQGPMPMSHPSVPDFIGCAESLDDCMNASSYEEIFHLAKLTAWANQVWEVIHSAHDSTAAQINAGATHHGPVANGVAVPPS